MLQESLKIILVLFILMVCLLLVHSLILQVLLITLGIIMPIYLLLLFQAMWRVLLIKWFLSSILFDYTLMIMQIDLLLHSVYQEVILMIGLIYWLYLVRLTQHIHGNNGHWTVLLYSNLSNSLSILFNQLVKLISVNFNSWPVIKTSLFLFLNPPIHSTLINPYHWPLIWMVFTTVSSLLLFLKDSLSILLLVPSLDLSLHSIHPFIPSLLSLDLIISLVPFLFKSILPSFFILNTTSPLLKESISTSF